MAITIPISFKQNCTDLELLAFLKEESEIVGQSSYMKSLLRKAKDEKDMQKKQKSLSDEKRP